MRHQVNSHGLSKFRSVASGSAGNAPATLRPTSTLNPRRAHPYLTTLKSPLDNAHARGRSPSPHRLWPTPTRRAPPHESTTVLPPLELGPHQAREHGHVGRFLEWARELVQLRCSERRGRSARRQPSPDLLVRQRRRRNRRKHDLKRGIDVRLGDQEGSTEEAQVGRRVGVRRRRGRGGGTEEEADQNTSRV